MRILRGAELVFGVGGVGLEGPLVVDESGVVVLYRFGLAAGFKSWLALGQPTRKTHGSCQEWQIRFAAQKHYPPELCKSLKV